MRSATSTPAIAVQVTLTSSDAAAVLPAAYTFAARDAGKHVFPVTLNTAGLQSITAADGTLTVVRANILVAGPGADGRHATGPGRPGEDRRRRDRHVPKRLDRGVADATRPARRSKCESMACRKARRSRRPGTCSLYGLAGNDTIRLMRRNGPTGRRSAGGPVRPRRGAGQRHGGRFRLGRKCDRARPRRQSTT